MKKTLAFMVMALALLLTQCKKPSIKFPTPSVTTTVSMTITAGPGSKTDITTAGGIVWSANDKIYVGDGAKCIGCLSIVSGVGNATGTFTGDVTAGTGDDCTFHFYYLGSATNVDVNATEVTVDFSSQNIYNNGGKLKNASGQHVGYGKAEHVKVEADKPVMGLEVTMKSKVAIAYFCFQKGEGESVTPYKGALTLSGDHIYNKMTVKFNESDFSFNGTEGDISLANTATHLKYAMLVPTNSTAEEILNFGGDVTGATALENGIEANKFYRIDDNMPIVVKVTPQEPPATPKFSVGASTKVEFAPGNLYWDGSEFRFETNQWDYCRVENCHWDEDWEMYIGDWDPSHVSHFKWSDKAHAVTGDDSHNDELFCNNNFIVAGDSHRWRTLSRDEWNYLLSINPTSAGQLEGHGRVNALSLSKWSAVTFGVGGPTVNGLILMPDGYDFTTTPLTDGDGTTSYARWQALETSGAVFLPAAGYRQGTGVYNVVLYGFYWSSTSIDEDYEAPVYSYFGSDDMDVINVDYGDVYGFAVRLVR